MQTLKLVLLAAAAGTLLCRAEPFQIKTMDDFWVFVNNVNAAQDEFYKQDVDLQTDLDFSAKQLTEPIGFSESGFKYWSGTFEGNGHVVKNLRQESLVGGLFGVVMDATIKSLVFDKSCNITGFMAAAAVATGANNTVFENVVNHGSITGLIYSGGIVAQAINGKLVSCVNDGTIFGVVNAGGLACFAGNVTFQKCFNHGTVQGQIVFNLAVSGGFAANGTGSVVVENCNNTGDVKIAFEAGSNGQAQCGGFIGYFTQGALSFINSNNIGSVTTDGQGGNNSVSGGFVGASNQEAGSPDRNQTLSFVNCHNFGTISSRCAEDAHSGGLIGDAFASMTHINKCSNQGSITATANEWARAAGAIGNSNDCTNEVKNFMNTADVTASGSESGACGIVGISPELKWEHDKTTIYNSVNKGNVKASGGNFAGGIAHNVIFADNVVSMGKVEGGVEMAQFWLAENQTSTNLFQLRDKCTDKAKDFVEKDGVYHDCNTGDKVVDALNAQAAKKKYGVGWLDNLDLNMSSPRSLSSSVTMSWACLFLLAASLLAHF